MALAFVRKSPNTLTPQEEPGVPVTTADLTLTAAPAVGNLLVLVMAFYRVGGGPVPPDTLTDNHGNTWVVDRTQSRGNGAVAICSTIVETTGDPFTITFETDGTSWWTVWGCMEYSGNAQTLGAAAVNSAGVDTSTLNSGTVSPAGNALYVGVCTTNDGAAVTLASGSFTERYREPIWTVQIIEAADLIDSGSQSCEWTVSGTHGMAGAIAAYNEAVATQNIPPGLLSGRVL